MIAYALYFIQQPVGLLADSPAFMIMPAFENMPVVVGDWEIVSISRYLDDLLIWLRHLHTGAEAYLVVLDAPLHLLHNLRSLLC